jgi:ABC-type uncharacterized transport system substrate-binding protein
MRRREFLAFVGALSLSPARASAQQPVKAHRLAMVHASVPAAQQTESGSPFYRGFFSELRRLGYREGENLLITRHSAEGQTAQYPEVARKVAQEKPDVIWGVVSSRLVQQLMAETTSIPIVAALIADPVGFGLATSLSRPGKNVTGTTSDVGLEIVSKRIELLREIVPGMSRLGVLISSDLVSGHVMAAIKQTAQQLDLAVVGPPLTPPIDEAEYRRVFLAMSEQRAGGVLLCDQPEHFAVRNRTAIAQLGMEHRLAVMGTYRQYAEAGLLANYGVDTADLSRAGAGQVEQILKGASPADMPIQQPTKFELILNLKTAKSLGLTMPASLVARADEVIE